MDIKIKEKIFKFAQKTKVSKIKTYYDYWNALFIGTTTASILICFQIIKDMFQKFWVILLIDLIALGVFVLMWFISIDKTSKLYIALEIKGKSKKEAYKIMAN